MRLRPLIKLYVSKNEANSNYKLHVSIKKLIIDYFLIGIIIKMTLSKLDNIPFLAKFFFFFGKEFWKHCFCISIGVENNGKHNMFVSQKLAHSQSQRPLSIDYSQ